MKVVNGEWAWRGVEAVHYLGPHIFLSMDFCISNKILYTCGKRAGVSACVCFNVCCEYHIAVIGSGAYLVFVVRITGNVPTRVVENFA